jgi:hypothetical protein
MKERIECTFFSVGCYHIVNPPSEVGHHLKLGCQFLENADDFVDFFSEDIEEQIRLFAQYWRTKKAAHFFSAV